VKEKKKSVEKRKRKKTARILDLRKNGDFEENERTRNARKTIDRGSNIKEERTTLPPL